MSTSMVSKVPSEQLLQGFRAAFRNVASTVGVITFEADGELHGMTATAICSLSGEPPSLIASVNRQNRTFEAIRNKGRFGVNFLSAGLEDLALTYAKPGHHKQIPASLVDFREGWPIPSLRGATASVVCELEECIPQFTHGLLIGRITHVGSIEEPADPLLYMGSSFHQLKF